MSRKERCPNCYTKLSEPVSFCPVCGRPTSRATDAERLEYDLGQWRRHVGRDGVAGPARPNGARDANRSRPATLGPERIAVVIPEARIPAASFAIDAAVPAAITKGRAHRRLGRRTENRIDAPRRPRRPLRERVRVPRLPRRVGEDRVILLDAADAFAYTACTSCERSDWIVRTTRNEDGTYNYWCIRCSRSFKTEVRIRHALKPFVTSGAVVAALAALSLLMR